MFRRRQTKYTLYRQPKFWDDRVIEKIIGIVFLMIVATIISGTLAFNIVFIWTYHPHPAPDVPPKPLVQIDQSPPADQSIPTDTSTTATDTSAQPTDPAQQ